MKQKRTYITVVLVAALLCLGIAYAAIQNTTLTVTTSSTSTADSQPIDVVITGVTQKTGTSSNVTVTGNADNSVNATLSMSGFTIKGDKGIATVTFKNNRTDVAATLEAVSIDAPKAEWFTVESAVDNANIAADGTTTATITVTLNKTVVDAADQTAAAFENCAIKFTAKPVANAD